MGLPVILTISISLVLFLPISFILMKRENKQMWMMFFFGGAAWSIVAVAQFVVAFLINLLTDFSIAENYSAKSMAQVQTEARTILFWYFVFLSLLALVILYRGTIIAGIHENLSWYIIYGLGWGVSEFIHRFAFGGFSSSQILYLGVFILILSSGTSMILIRTPENSGYIIYATFLKFFSELTLFGGVGYDNPDFFEEATYVLILSWIMIGLTLLTRKFPLEKDKPVNTTS